MAAKHPRFGGYPLIPRNNGEGTMTVRIRTGGPAASPAAGTNATHVFGTPVTFVPAAGEAAGPPGIPRNIIQRTTTPGTYIGGQAASLHPTPQSG